MTTRCTAITNNVPQGNPILSNSIPATVGPIKAPKAKVEVQRPKKQQKVHYVAEYSMEWYIHSAIARTTFSEKMM